MATFRAPQMPWQRLRDWIDEQESWERKHGRPAHLSQNQVTAISSLVHVFEEPELDGADYISKLYDYLQTNKFESPTWIEGKPEVYLNMVRWRVHCQPHGCQYKFPMEGFGYEAGQEAPKFTNKKTAKHFAAKQALLFLLSPPRRKRAPSTSTDSQSRPRKKVKIESPPPNAEEEGGVAFANGGGPSPAGSGKEEEEEEEGLTIFNQVANLAGRLGYSSPTYKVEADGEAQWDMWKGRPDFREDARVPADLGLVTKVVGKKQTRLAIAQKVLVWLKEQEQARKDVADRFLSTIGQAPTSVSG